MVPVSLSLAEDPRAQGEAEAARLERVGHGVCLCGGRRSATVGVAVAAALSLRLARAEPIPRVPRTVTGPRGAGAQLRR